MRKLSSKTTVKWSNIIREAQLRWCVENTLQILGGSGNIAEVDEAKFGHLKYSRGRMLDSEWIFGGIPRDSKMCSSRL